MKYSLIFSSLALAALLQACTPIGVATTAAVTGGTAAARETGFRQTAIDTRIKLEVNEAWFKYDLDAFSKLSVTVEQGRVLVTGVVQNPDHRVEAIRLAWQPAGVVQVINEVRVANSEGLSGFARDTLISGNLRTKIIFDKEIKSINYTIETVQGTVYLMGTAQDRVELNKVIDHARNTSYVRQVVSYVKIKSEPIEAVGDPVLTQSSEL
jgi:osmotically-inducible protein OsmY